MKKVKRLAMQALGIIASVCFLSSCSGNGYTNAIPQNVNAVMQIDISKADGQHETPVNLDFIKKTLQIDDANDCGIDLKRNIYLFETEDGNLGLCAKTSDKDKLKELIDKLAASGKSSKPVERRGNTFALVNNSLVIGFSSDAVIVSGPFLPAQMADATRTISRWLKQDEEHSAAETPIFDRLKETEGMATIVARGDALPQQLAALLTIGKPKGAGKTDIYITATLEKKGDTYLNINAETSAENETLKKALETQAAKMRPIGKRFINCAPADALCSVFTNMQGTDFLGMLHANEDLGVILAGANTAIDMDNILRSVDGQMITCINSYSADSPSLSIAAQIKDSKFLNDVDYWKKSCSQGATIETLSPNAYVYKSGETAFWFGVSKGKEFYGSTEKTLAPGILSPATVQLPVQMTSELEGKRFGIVINLKKLLSTGDGETSLVSITEPFLGNIQYILYSIK